MMGDGALVASTASNLFCRFTFDDKTASEAIMNAFNTAFALENATAEVFSYGYTSICIKQYNAALETDVTYYISVTIHDNSICVLGTVYAEFTYEGRGYNMAVFTNVSSYDIPVPAALQ